MAAHKLQRCLTMATPRARDVMEPHPAVIQQSSTLRVAVERLFRLHVRHLPVLDQTTLVGMISDRDIREVTTAALSPQERNALLDMTVERMMSTDPVTVTPDTPLHQVIDLMLDNEVGALPVLEADKILVGIVSYVDVLRYFRRRIH